MSNSIEQKLADVEKTLSVLVTKQDYNAEFITGLRQSVDEIRSEMRENYKKIFENYTTKSEVHDEITGAVAPIRSRIGLLEKIVYGAIGIITTGFLGFLVASAFGK